jgi:TolB protein
MKNVFKIQRFVFLLLCIACIFTLPQCSKNDFDDGFHTDPIVPIEPIIPVDPLDTYSTIAFIARITDNSAEWSLCVMDASGNGIRKIVDKSVACHKPVRSYSGMQLLFTAAKFDSWVNDNNSVGMSSEYGLYIVNIDGTGLTLIDCIDRTEIGTFGSVAWAPDDKYIVYVKYSGASWEKRDLILYNISDNTRKTLKTIGDICTPTFSPDGKYIAYCASVENAHHIYKMEVSNNHHQLIISNAASPKWSPQGDKIVYSTTGKDRSAQIAVADADGRNRKQLTSSVSPTWWDTGFPRGGNSDPQWTSDGKKIVYVSSENERAEIFIMNSDGSKQTRLTKAEYWDGSPEVTPDGKYILFHSRRSDMMESGICMMNLDGSNQKVLSKVGSRPIACR